MKIDGFVDIEMNKGHWGFFAISCDYALNKAAIYFKIFDKSVLNNSMFKTIDLDY